MLYKKAFKRSEEPIYKLSSGKMSNLYVNCKPVTLSSTGMNLIGHLILEEIHRNNIQLHDICAIGGLTFGADPIAVATAFVSDSTFNPINAFSVRRWPKKHGIMKWIEGDLTENAYVVIVEDVVTTGNSVIKAINRVRTEGLNVSQIITLIDRQEGGMENIQKYVENTSAIVKIDELFSMA
jgi:orotate phosphoribosyltransferase